MAGLFALFLNSCTSLTPESSMSSSENDQLLAQLESWSLRGRLNIRRGESSDTININWQQAEEEFDINLSGTLGLGAVRINGKPGRVVIEKAGEAPIIANSLQEISSDILGYAFPASSLLYWIKGLPAPDNRADISRNAEGFVATLSQLDRQGARWELQYDRYQNVDNHILPGRIRLEQPPYRLTFVVNSWGIMADNDGDSD